MSIASEITSMGENLKKDYQSIANLGADLTNVDKNIENISSLLDNVYDVLPKTSFQEGTEITLSNTLKGKLDYAKEFQEVEYIESTGTQYIDTGYIANNNTSEISVKFNATHTQNDGGFVFSGEFGFNTYACHLYNSSSKLDIGFGTYELTDISYDANVLYEIIIQKGKYIVNGNEYTAPRLTGDIQTNNSIYLFALNRGSGAILNANDQIRMYHFAIKENNVLVRDMVPCYRKSDGVIGMYDKVQDKFYTNIGTSTFTKGADVGNGFVDIVGFGQAGQESTQGYNELNIYVLHPKGYTETVSGVDFKYNDDGSVTANGKATADINFFLGSRATLGDIFNGTYYLSGCTTGSNTTYFLSMWADGIGVYPQTTTEVATNKTSGVNWNIVIAVKNGATINATFYPMMCATSGKTFEPYTGGYASPSPNWQQLIQCVTGEQEIVESGKNLFDKDNANILQMNLAGSTTTSGLSASNRTLYVKIKPNTTYTISKIASSYLTIGTTETTPNFNMAYSQRQANNSGTSITITTSSTANYLMVWYYNSGSDTSVTEQQILDSIMICEGNDTYEPYHTPITYPISLGSNKFYKIGDYADELLYDVDEDKVYKKAYIGEATIDGSGLWWETTQGVHKRYYTQLTNGSSSTSVSCFANYFKGVQRSNLANDNECSAQQYANFVTDNFADLEAFQTWLSTHNVVLQYVLATPTLTEITDTTLKQQVKNWYYSQSFTGTTILESNGDLPMIIKVRALKGE